MTYNNNIMHSQQPHIPGAMGQASAMFQPGYANTNTQEVQYWNQGGHTSHAQIPSYGMSYGGGLGGTQAMFQPGYANTNAQEVRQFNQGYSTPNQQGFQQTQMNSYQQAQPINYLHPNQGTNYMQAQSTYQPAFGAATNSIFSPGFAGTNVQEVQQRNNTGYAGISNYQGQANYTNNTGYSAQTGGSIFSPGFAGTNVQEVRQLNQGGTASSGLMNAGYNAGYSQQPQQQMSQQPYQNYGNAMGIGSQSVFSPGFAGTNVQEVRSLNNGGQATAHTGSIFPGSF
ncbi:hypothetical protein [Brevibacillus nitrificans]|uniref:hypothetical protein n=1 Tax=Brevibacillus nitrificans TaxID=651560 RepID=UPI0028553B4E|nr:hypothetical protein [Brevibacillus nitrificans]MDR7314786.1 hypothetical protein [Brevibacillus nitrificans]